MVKSSYWEEGSKHQWIYYANDNSALDGLSEKINPDDVLCTASSEIANLGIKRINGRLYAGNFVGICRLRGVNGKVLTTEEGKEIILKIEPRFPTSVVDMLNSLRDDDEFERYLAPQTNRINEADREIEDLGDNELFHFFYDEDPILLKDCIAHESSIITATVFITLLKSICSRPLMGKMVSKEENLIGKAKGKIVFKQNLRKNLLHGREDRLYCRYLQYTEDILENQVLKAAFLKAEKFLNHYFGSASSSNNTFRDMLTYCRNALAHISCVKISRLDLGKIKTSGVYVYYKPVINAAKMVLSEITLEANGNSAITSYVVPYAVSMDKLFEMYVRAYFKRAGVKSYDSAESGVHMCRYDDKRSVLTYRGKDFANYIGGNIKPDIILYDPSTEKVAVFDVKYKDSLSTRYSRPDRLQILAYGLVLGCDNVGNIFPARSSDKNTYYTQNEISSHEMRTRYYNQLELAIDSRWKFELIQTDGSGSLNVITYIENLLLANEED